MNGWRWAPLRYIIRKAATSQGFLDPIEILGRLRGLAQPSEVGEPIELLRAGVVFHARGLINSKVIQHNLDWVWPYWVERQYDPRDRSFLPRAFSVTHVNLTHRNWTAVGYPDCDALPVVDPRGLLTPFLDGWSIDAWVLGDDGRRLLPARCDDVDQRYELADGAAVETRSSSDGLGLALRAEVVLEAGRPVCRLRALARNDRGGAARLVLALRPQNAEGVSFVNRVALDGRGWHVNGDPSVVLDPAPVAHYASSYREGDVLFQLDGDKGGASAAVDCPVGLASAAAVYPFDEAAEVSASIPLGEADPARPLMPDAWARERDKACRLECPEPHYRFLFDAAVTSLVLHTPEDAYPGPYTYKRFWFRDAAFIIHALLALGLEARARRAIECFFARQTPLGYFRSQEGEWDSNGEVLWLLDRYRRLQGGAVPAHWREPVDRAARWISRKCLPESPVTPHAGLLPAGFSAEHLGPNDYYYWDDFWSIAGLRAAAGMLADDEDAAQRAVAAADRLAAAVDRSLASARERLGRPAMPAAPYRRLDAGAIGSVAAGYPLQLFAPGDERLLDCVRYLLDECFVDGAFFQDMIHSGQNAYLTLQVAQVLLRAGDPRYLELMDAVARLASPTGQWPEAIHPQTGGGCMGDGHHVWAAAEWVLMLRHCFLREEGDTLVLASGIPARWLASGEPVAFGPAPTVFGPVTVRVAPEAGNRVRVSWEARWHREAPALRVALPGYAACGEGDASVLLEPRKEREMP